MGTAPGDQQHPAMPDPVRTVTRSAAMLRTMGFGDEQALNLILSVAVQVKGRMVVSDSGPLDWVEAVIDTASSRIGALSRARPHRSEMTDANGRRG